jgi:hypothetical protein
MPSKRKARTPGAVSPWAATKQAEMQAQPANRPFIWLLTDLEGAQLIAAGTTPEYVVAQAERALEWLREG